mmetsp:Transcript_43004/g.127500  ORF Transcript_43004/g.127500 Transcript_43004/m.127500 type:complete len:125 (+) Transcript_43004:2-376(+)
MLRDLIGSYNSERGATKVGEMERDLEDVTDMMRDNLSKVMERGERIESLIDKTSTLKNESVSFHRGAKRHNDDLWWKDFRGRLFFALCVMAILVVAFYYNAHHQMRTGDDEGAVTVVARSSDKG